MIKLGAKYFKNNGQVIYGISLIILTLLLIVLNTVVVLNSSKRNMHASLQLQGLYLSRQFITTSYQEFADKDYGSLQDKLDRIRQASPHIIKMDVLEKNGEIFNIVASLDRDSIGSEAKDTNYILSWAVDNVIATDLPDTRENSKGSRLWEIVTPVHDDNGDKKAIVVLQLSDEIIADLEKDILGKSSAVLLATLLIVGLLLTLNARLFEYAILFKKLKEVDTMKDEFISIASHELRTPITTIKGFLSMLLEGDYGSLGEEGTKTLKIMDASVKRLGSLVEDLLNVSRIEQNRLKLSSSKVNAKEIIDSIGDEFELRVKEKNLKLKLQIADDLPNVFADEDKLRQILVNLVGNSVKYTKQGEIEIIAKVVDKKFVNITIKDTGIGMTAQEREQLFEKFYRIQGDDTKGIVGTGLGLWITKQLVELQGGEIFVDSIKHVGSQFYFTVPIYAGQKYLDEEEKNK